MGSKVTTILGVDYLNLPGASAKQRPFWLRNPAQLSRQR